MSSTLDKFQQSLKADECLPESIRIQFLLANLGESWDIFLTSYLNSRFDKKKTTYDEISSILIQEEMRTRFNAASANHVKAQKHMGSDNKSGKEDKKDNKDGKKKKKKCEHCGSKKHCSKNCWHKHPEKAPLDWKPRSSEANAISGEKKDKKEKSGETRLTSTSFRTYSDDKDCYIHIASMIPPISEPGRITVNISKALRATSVDDWIIDSVSTEHLTRDETSFLEGTRKPYKHCIYTATGQQTHSKWIGDVLLRLWYGDGKYREVCLHDVLYMPEVRVNLLGTIRMGRRGIGIDLTPHGVMIYDYTTTEILGYGLILGNTYVLQQSDDSSAMLATTKDQQTVFKITNKSTDRIAKDSHVVETNNEHLAPKIVPHHPKILSQTNKAEIYKEVKESPIPSNVYQFPPDTCEYVEFPSFVRETSARSDDIEINAMKKDRVNLFTWHRRFAHMSIPNVIRASKMTEGMDIQGLAVPKHACKSCHVALATIHNGKKQLQPVKKRGERIFVDLGGGHSEMPFALVGGGHYWMFIVDQHDAFTKAFILKYKYLAAKMLIHYIEGSEQAGHPILCVHSDNGGEFQKKEFTAWIRARSIEWEWTAAYAHSQNAPAERVSLTIMNRVCAVLHYEGLSRELWAELVLGVTFLKNLSPVTRHSQTLYKKCFGIKPDVSSLRALGCKAYLTIPGEVRERKKITKIDPRAVPVRLVGYTSLGKQYVVWDPSENTIKRARDLTWDEGSDPELYRSPDDDYGRYRPPTPLPEEKSSPSPSTLPKEPNKNPDALSEFVDPGIYRHIEQLVEDHPDYTQPTLIYLICEGVLTVGKDEEDIEPANFKEAMASPERKE